ncbi:SpoIIE family protein phosphatase [Mycobacterium sp. SMC-4]|uniref:SpoIIE family protein phosphatase n=1 Tax=Mycobacterium sp. SMC-4 TaxID=2857059 RepID=UPI0021B2329B|nr:SpoIIE family protein phosphatase [Mycobacterium sp. SMC-4]UXA16053.1 SpoIIE family protein phosphatase [Mycobacterium sp. SMC-4]
MEHQPGDSFAWQSGDHTPDHLHDQPDDPVAAREQMERLVGAIIAIGSDLDVERTLRRVVDAARELSQARYATLAVRGADGAYASLVGDGLDEDAAGVIGAPPPDRQPSDSFLEVPIVVRGADFGTLFLRDDRPGRLFTEAQQSAVRALATAATAAIDNARLFEREREGARWTKASREITTALLSGDPQLGTLQLIVNRALELADAEQAILLVPRDSETPGEVTTLVVAATAGRYSAEVIGRQVPMDGSTTGGVARRGLPLITDSFQYPIEGFTDVGERSAIVMPLIADDQVLGVIAVARRIQQTRFDEAYLELVSDFARHAAIALALAAGREHALNQELAQANTVEDAVVAAAEQLRRLWRARRVLAVTFPAHAAPSHATPKVAVVGETVGEWDTVPAHIRAALLELRDAELLTPYTSTPGAAGIAIQHPDGVLVVWIELTEQRPFTLEDQTLLTVLAGRLSQGLQRVHQVDQQRETALALQHAILGPADLPQGFAVRYQAASKPLQVGGDWYDVVDLEDGRVALVVGDCVGHGLAAATVMGQVRSACRALLYADPSPGAALVGLDRFAARLPGAQCTTAVCAVLDTGTGELVYSSAGHPPPILVHSDGNLETLDEGHSIALGLRVDWTRPEARVTIPARATLVLYTDGLVERRDTGLEHGISRAAEYVHDHRDSALEVLANQTMSGLAPSNGYQDDVVLLMYRQPAPLELDFLADANNLAPARAALRGWLSRAGVEPTAATDVLVAAGEAVTNAIEHGHRHTPDGTISLRATASAECVHLTIADTGSWKQPRTSPESNRGRGIDLMRMLMHEVTIEHDTAGTTVELSARIT